MTLVAEVVRSGFVESRHHGSVVVLDADGKLVAAAGEPDDPIFPRSANKPMQAAGMVRAGLDLTPPELALVAASHSGEPRHLAVVRSILAAGGLTEADLRCPADLPIDVAAGRKVLADGGGPSRILMNCSGKHAGMLRTCLVNDWPTAGYTEPDHPLQARLRTAVEDLAGEPVAAVGVDGCGVPLLALSLVGVARAFLAVLDREPAVAGAMRDHADLVGGTGRDVTALMAGIPGLLAKDGAEAVYAAALAGVGAVAVKIGDGNPRARVPVLVSGLRRLGLAGGVLDRLAETPIHGGGQRVGSVRSVW